MSERPTENHRTAWRLPLALGAAAVAAAVLPLPPSAVERLFSTGFYAALQPRLTALSNRVPFPLFDAALVLVVALWVGLAARDFLRLHAVWRAARHVIARTMVWAAAIYLVFLSAWGFNYRRVRLVEALPYDASRVTPHAVAGAATLAVQRLNALYDGGHADDGNDSRVSDPTLAASLQRALAEIGRPHRLVPGRPKRTLLDPYFRRAGVDGMTDPFFLETLIAADILPFERPFIVAHEWAHLGGMADEGEANFVGWLACLRASPAAQYSGWLFLYRELMQEVASRERAAIAAALAPGPRADLRAIRDRLARDVDPRVSAVGWTVYDSYLKANRVEAGAASYGEVVRLVVGARLPSGWQPLEQ